VRRELEGEALTRRDWHGTTARRRCQLSALAPYRSGSRAPSRGFAALETHASVPPASSGRAAPNPRGAALHLIAAPMFLS
jgi:hypothetical protein